jgi:Rad3-related DNA helicase
MADTQTAGASYFARNYPVLAIPIATDDPPAFRDAQRAALFSLGAHFAQRNDPSIVTMPTGSGKTAVLQTSAFLLRAIRVLVVTPSRLVREQSTRITETATRWPPDRGLVKTRTLGYASAGQPDISTLYKSIETDISISTPGCRRHARRTSLLGVSA